VHQQMAVQARTTCRLRVGGLVAGCLGAIHRRQSTLGQSKGAAHRRAVVTAVALLAQVGCAGFEQGRIDRTVRGVAVAAIVSDRTVLPKEGTPFSAWQV